MNGWSMLYKIPGSIVFGLACQVALEKPINYLCPREYIPEINILVREVFGGLMIWANIEGWLTGCNFTKEQRDTIRIAYLIGVLFLGGGVVLGVFLKKLVDGHKLGELK